MVAAICHGVERDGNHATGGTGNCRRHIRSLWTLGLRCLAPAPLVPVQVARLSTTISSFCDCGAGHPHANGHPLPAVLWPQLPDRGGDRGGGSGRRGLNHPGARHFLTYIRTSPTRLAQLSRTLTNRRRQQ